MKLDGTFLGSRFARRIVLLLIVAALIPIAVTVVLSFGSGHDTSSSAWMRVFLPVTGIALLWVALLSVRQVRRILDPLEKLIDGTRRAGNQDFSTRLDVSVDNEFGELATSFNSMASRLGSQFTALASLADIDDAILSRHDLDRVIETMVLRMRDIVPADFVSIAIVDRNAPGRMRISTRDQRNEGAIEHQLCMHSPDGAAGLLAHANGVWLDRKDALEPYLVPVQKLGAATLLVLPIAAQNAVVGAVVLGFSEAKVLSDEERARARTLGDRVGLAFATVTKDERLYYQANYDALTELPNRLHLKDHLARRLAEAQREQQTFAVLFIDLDSFKSINDTLGHASGDDVLRQTALRLKGCVRETDIVARLGGDEFTIILSQIRSARDPESIAAHVTQSMATPFALGGAEHVLSASVGIAIYPADGASADELLRNADTAMYRAKDGGGGRYVYFEERMNVAALARLKIERELQRAIDRSEFSLAYQPQLDLRSGRISGAEALLRWGLPGREQRLPAEFMQIAEETGLIEPIGDWMLIEACRQFRAWEDAGIDVPRLAVNVSARQLRQKDFVEKVREIVASTGVPPYCIELEISESLLIDANGGVARTLDALKSLGVTFCLDEFGTGHSSLTCLNRYPIENVKIDRSFVPAIGTDNGTDAMVAAIVSMAHALSKRVVADGVESEKHAALLGRLGCDQIQGRYVGRALDAAMFAEFVKESAASAAKRPTFLTRSAARA